MISTPIRAAAGRPLQRPPRPPRRTGAGPRPAAQVVLGLLLLVVVAACSGGATPSGVASLVDPSASPDASPAPSVDPEAAMLAFTDCMREHGIDIEVALIGEDGGRPVKGTTKGSADDRGAPDGFDKGAFAAAEKACRPLLPQGGVNGPGGEIDPEFQDKMLAFAKCMREHGIDMPDPQFGTGGNTVTIGLGDDGSGDGPRIDPQSQEFQDAEAACGSMLPGKLGGPGTGGAGTQVKP